MYSNCTYIAPPALSLCQREAGRERDRESRYLLKVIEDGYPIALSATTFSEIFSRDSIWKNKIESGDWEERWRGHMKIAYTAGREDFNSIDG